MKRRLLYVAISILASILSFNVSGQLSGFYQEDFEGTFPPAGWQTIDVSDPTAVWSQSNQVHYSGTHSAFMHWSDYYAQGEDWLILPQFTVGASDSLSFWMALHDVSFAPDSTWILVSSTTSDISSFTSVVDTLSEGDNYPSVAGVFQYYSFSLSAFTGLNIYVAIKNRNQNGDGVYVDLVTIGSTPSLDAAAISIDVQDVVSTTHPTVPKATVKNNALANETFSVTMNITGGYSSTKSVTNLAGGASQQVDFDSWLPADTGDYIISIQTQLAGDVIPANDTLSKVVIAYDPLSGFYQEDFEGTFPPSRWIVEDVSDSVDTWHQVSGLDYSGTHSAFLPWSLSYVQGEDWLILPQFAVTATDSFSFWLATEFTGFSPDSTYILISTTDNSLTSFTNTLGTLSEGANYPAADSTYFYYSYSLDAYAGQNIYVAFKNRNMDGDGILVDLVSIGTPLGDEASEVDPDKFNFSSHPNPFSKVTSISFSLDQESSVRISIVDITGKEVAELCNKTLQPGSKQITWNASGFSAGIYFCKIDVNGNVATQKLVKLN